MADSNGTAPSNGTPAMGDPQERVAELLQDEVTTGYRPVMPLEAMWMAGAGDMPQITLRRDIVFMQMHPIVITSLDYYKSGIMGAEFWGGPDNRDLSNDQGKPISPDPRVCQFVLAHCERFWERGVPVQQEGGYPWGWSPGEHIYKESQGMLVWSHLKGFHPDDGYILTYMGDPVGVRVKNIKPIVGDQRPRGSTCDLWFASDRVPAKAGWYPHRARFNSFYGNSQLTGAWLPWRMLGWRDGMDQVVNAAVYRGGYRGPIVRYPPEDSQTALTGVPATQLDGRGQPRRNSRDVARQIVEWAKAGAGFAISSAQYPEQLGGGNKWDVDWPDHVMNVGPLVDAARWCEERIMLGIGVPPELVRAGGTGSGYSGRSIPREAFLEQQQRVADSMLQIFVEQVIRPLVLWNFGEVPFNVSVKSLLKTQAENRTGGTTDDLPQPSLDQQAQAKQQGQQPQPGGGQPGQGGQQQPPQPAAMSLVSIPSSAPVVSDRARGIAERVLRRRAG